MRYYMIEYKLSGEDDSKWLPTTLTFLSHTRAEDVIISEIKKCRLGVQRDFRIVTLAAEDEKSAKNLGSTSTPSTPNMPKFAVGMVVMHDPQPGRIRKCPMLIFDSVFENGEWLYNGNYYEAGLRFLTPLEATGKE